MRKVKAKVPQGHVKIEIRSSSSEEGHLFVEGVVPSKFAGDIIAAVIERSVRKERQVK